ncbi:uncharacterized protein F4807DRAFT_183528 [Annulohypoxylon truncatum]|uniref:uncharacterized protein n=1 Tax=Annulohypoxylon truncatum TaxID=327061 RepID=UPI002008EA7B|nr:uncharacterized protein F4807DRAFT_183528 [Annulohypoxylon truncatum]KAI1207298.1 hypothetical protein F4807DRAFT_183528 [Annulohypoxylon truncatum]
MSAAMNVKARRKATPNTAQGWVPPSSSNQHRKITFDSYHSHLVSIAKAIYAANGEYLAIVEDYLRWRNWSKAKTAFGFSQKPGRFTNDDLTVLKDLVAAGPPVGQSAVPQLLDRLRQTSYIDIWRRATENMAYLKNHPTHQTKKHLENGRKRAERMKACRVIVETSYHKVENELRNQMHISVCDGVVEKLAMLRKYEDAYPVTSSSESSPDTRFKLPIPIYLCCILACLFLALIFIGVAWSKSSNALGSTNDTDFWTLLAFSTVQLLGFYTTVSNVSRKSTEKSVAWTCALYLTAFGIICTLVSIPAYTYLPTMWSTLLAFGAAVAQLVVLLELLLMADHSKTKQA